MEYKTLVEELDEIYMNGFHDDELGSVDDFGWYGLLRERQAILEVDSQGFKQAYTYETLGSLEKAWSKLEEEYAEWVGEYDDI